MTTTGGITPLQQSFQECLADNHLCDESGRAKIEPALDEAIRTDLSSIPQTLNWLYQESKGTVSEPIQRLIEQKLTAAYASRLLTNAKDANGLLPDEFAAIYDDAGLQKLMNRFGAGAINLFLSNTITLASARTKLFIDAGILTYFESELIDDGVSRDLITQYKGLGISKPEDKKRKRPIETSAQRKARREREAEARRRKEAEEKARGAEAGKTLPPAPKPATEDEATDAI